MEKRYSGKSATLFLASSESPVLREGELTVPGKKYFIMEKGTESDIPLPAGMYFQAGKTPLELKEGDRIQQIDGDRICKTTCTVSLEQSSIDCSDDCNPAATISSGIVGFSGSFSRLFTLDQETESLNDVTKEILSRFITIVEDDGQGAYTVSPINTESLHMMININSEARGDKKYNIILCAPIVLTSTGLNFENGAAIKNDIAFTCGQGNPQLLSVPVAE